MRSDHHYSKQKKITLAVLVLVIIAAILAVLYFLFLRLEQRSDAAPEGAGTAASRAAEEELLTDPPVDMTPEPAVETPGEDEDLILYYNGQAYRYNKDLSVLLVLGVDDYDIEVSKNHRNQSQADLLLVAVFDHTKHTYKILQLNRDSMVDDPVLSMGGSFIGYNFEQIALCHTYGRGLEDSCENSVHAVTHFLYETPIDNYFALTMSAIPIMNDLVGGVTVTIEDDFTGIDDTLVKGRTVTLDENNVENYVRSRFKMTDDPTNLARMRRQRTYMSGLMSAVSEAVKKDSSFVMNAYFSVDDYLVTDCTIEALNDYAEQFSDYTSEGFVTPAGENKVGEEFMEFYVDEADLQRIVIETFYIPVEE